MKSILKKPNHHLFCPDIHRHLDPLDRIGKWMVRFGAVPDWVDYDRHAEEVMREMITRLKKSKSSLLNY